MCGISHITLSSLHKEGETSDDSDDEYAFGKMNHRLEDYEDWHYDTSPVVPVIIADEDIRTVRNAENNDGQGPTFRMGNEDKPDLHSEPVGRAKS